MSLRWNERLIARLNAEKETPQYRNTSSRLHKWKELVEIAQKDLDLPVASPERIMPGHIVIFRPHLEIGMILSVWKGIKAPKLCAGECHVNSCTAFRAVSLDIVDEEARQAQGPLWIRRNKYARGTLGAGFGYAFLHTPCVDERNNVSGQRHDSLFRLRPSWRQKDKFTPWCKACDLQQSLIKEMATRKETNLMMVVVVVAKILSSSAFHVFFSLGDISWSFYTREA